MTLHMLIAYPIIELSFEMEKYYAFINPKLEIQFHFWYFLNFQRPNYSKFNISCITSRRIHKIISMQPYSLSWFPNNIDKSVPP
jgi:hypothetical protein